MSVQTKHVDLALPAGQVLRIEPITAHSFRIRLSSDRTFPEPRLIRYGILRRDWPDVDYQSSEDNNALYIHTSEAELTVRKADGRLTIKNAQGAVLTEETAAPCSAGRAGFGAEFALADDERLYGLGDETRETVEKRGHIAEIWVTNVTCYVPIPFLMSNRGWAIFLNSTWRHSWDVGSTQPDRLRFGGPQGELDYYIFVGPDMPALLDRYTDLAGKPHMLPDWGYALTFVCNQQANAREMVDDALNLRREGIPCDLIGLEPGWMEKRYDYSIDKKWHPERFYIPYWATKGPQTFAGVLDRLGFKLSLWLCCDYDLTFEEEREAMAAGIPEPANVATLHADDFEQDRHFMTVVMDQITKPAQPWFEHLRQFVDQGVSAFKLDGANQIAPHPDRRWANGMADEEMHNLYPTILNKQMHRGYKQQTGRRAMVYSAGGYAGIQQFSATWAGDTGGGPKPLVSMLNHGMSGHVNTSCDMDVFTPAGIHFGFLQSWSQVCSWAYWRHPWLLGEKLQPMFTYYANLRYRLLPYIYSTAHVAAHSGMPIMRSMPLMFPDDAQSDALLSEYMLGDAFLATAFAEKVHLPEGRWIDYWTGKSYQGPLDLTVGPEAWSWPADRGGALFVRAGAIIPCGPVMDYVGQKPLDSLELHVYPEGDSSFTLYEDDGISYDYLKGDVTRTSITSHRTASTLRLSIASRAGEYAGMPQTRSFDVRIHDAAPKTVTVNGSATDWNFDAASATINLYVVEDAQRKTPVVVECKW